MGRRSNRETEKNRTTREQAEEDEIVRKLDGEYGPALSHEESMRWLKSLPKKRLDDHRG